MLKNNIKILHFCLLISFVNFLFFHFPFFKYVFDNIDYKSTSGIILIISLLILVIVLNAFVFYLVIFLSRIVGKFLLVLFFLINSISIYFVNTYGVIIDESMIGNVFNTNYNESSSFFSLKLVLYFILFGILPSIYIIKVKIINVTLKKYFTTLGLTLVFISILVIINSSNILWIDKNSKHLGGLAMPWNYTVNISLYYKHKNEKNEKEILLPNAIIKDTTKSVVILIIGESARKQNFSLYGYPKNTNPLLSKVSNLYHFDATSCSTYTTASLKCILEHANSNDLYEILPNYLYRNNVDVVWRTSNWGEPPIHIKNYIKSENLMPNCIGEGCNYDEILLTNLKEQIKASTKNKIFIVLHTSTSHGPTYSKKYPQKFETFKPVCNSVELGNCSQIDLVNAYDNSIIYTDYIINEVIENLKELKEFKSSMIYVSDHGESLGEKNLYMHGLPMSIAPKEQYEIPFIVWVSENSKQLKPNKILTQNHVFHSVMSFLSIDSPIYNEELNIFK